MSRVTVYNSSMNVLEVGGVFWAPRVETNIGVSDEGLEAVLAHPKLRVVEKHQDLTELGKDELVELAKAKGVPHSGNKDEIISRLKED